LIPSQATHDAGPDFAEIEETEEMGENLADFAGYGDDEENDEDFEKEFKAFINSTNKANAKQTLAENFIRCRQKGFLFHVAAIVCCDYHQGKKG
jgi:hypothetical protein